MPRSRPAQRAGGADRLERTDHRCGRQGRSKRQSGADGRALDLSTEETAHETRSDLTEKLLDIKREKGWSWKHICEKIGGYSEVLIVGAILGQMKLTKPQAANAGELFGLSKSETAMLNEVPMRGEGTPMPPTDPLIYRFYEMVMVNGPAWKALIEEEFGDGIMSAIDFDMVMERVANPKGDRVKITMSRQIPAVQILRRQRQRAGIWVQGRVRGRRPYLRELRSSASASMNAGSVSHHSALGCCAATRNDGEGRPLTSPPSPA